MKKVILQVLILFNCTLAVRAAPANELIRFEVKFPKQLAVFVFVQNLNLTARPNFNIYRSIFLKSEYNKPEYENVLALFKAASLNYGFTYSNYPHKNEFDAIEFVKRNLIVSSSLEDFRMRVLGFVPILDINNLIRVLQAFTPVYDKLIYDTAKPIIEREVQEIQHLLTQKKIDGYFDEAKKFYQSSWDASIPLQIVLYPLPQSQAFGATAYIDVAESAIPNSMKEYSGMITVLLHEASHILYGEQPPEIQSMMQEWLNKAPSRYTRFAAALLDEAWATAIANGYFAEKIQGSLNSGSWYNQKYINLMAKAAPPVIKEYLQAGKPMDQVIFNRYVSLFEDSAELWMHAMPFLMTYRSVISDKSADFDTLRRLFPYAPEAIYYPDFSAGSFNKLQKQLVKCIIISSDHAAKITLVKKAFPELQTWNPDIQTDFTCMKFLEDKSVILIINLVARSLREQARERIQDIFDWRSLLLIFMPTCSERWKADRLFFPVLSNHMAVWLDRISFSSV